ncbi:MAG: hypothetical protein Q9N34_00100 [Aquificota bacterium]|nr:hypothetical protein [Aquificota bacterium]
MLRRVVFKDLDVNALNLQSVLEEVSRRNITGYLKIVYWDSEDYLTFVEGDPGKAVSISVDGKRLIGDPGSFSVKGKEGTATLVETTLDDLVGFLEYRHQPERDGPLTLFPYGTLTQEPVSLSFLNLDREMTIASRSHLTGYVALYTPEDLIGLVVFNGGQPVAVFSGNGSRNEEAVVYINMNLVPRKSYISMYAVEPEMLSFLVSMHRGNIHPVDSVFMTYQEAENLVVRERKDAIVLVESGGLFRYDLFFRGQKVERILKEKGFLVEDEDQKNRLSVKVENMPDRKVKVYEITIEERMEPVEVTFETLSVQEAEDEVPSDLIDTVRSEFIRKLGPVGRVLWDRILNDMGFREGSLTKAQIKALIPRLRDEIPDEDARREFLEKIREISPDMI